MKTTDENNRKIALFMGRTNPIARIITNYDKDWNLLMEVVERIESLGYVIKTLSTPTISKRWYVYYVTIKKVEGDGYIVKVSSSYENNESKLLTYHRAVVEFIDWYNLNKSK